jgi:hypothetical protein
MPNCDAIDFLTYEGTVVRKFPGSAAYFYVTDRMAIDADGAPNAYHPEDRGIDALANAGFPHAGWKSILVADPLDPGRPFVQPAGPFAGFVSKTTLQDPTCAETDPARYVDSTRVPYLVFPGAFHALASRPQPTPTSKRRGRTMSSSQLLLEDDAADLKIPALIS